MANSGLEMNRRPIALKLAEKGLVALYDQLHKWSLFTKTRELLEDLTETGRVPPLRDIRLAYDEIDSTQPQRTSRDFGKTSVDAG
jgi:hypothetical protein